MSDTENNKNISDLADNLESESVSDLVSESVSEPVSDTSPIQSVSINSTLGTDSKTDPNTDPNTDPEYTYPEDIIDTTLTPKPNPTNFKQLIGSYVKLLQMKMNTDDIKFLKKFHPDDYDKKLAEFVPAFKEEYPFLFKMIISGTDLAILDMFLENISDIDSGKKSLNDARSHLGTVLHNKFVKDKIK